ncbi:hypothetical protein D7V97_19225 [Corallococcus sp. CA053C]|nr:hypothetical protein D7V97_19225 [Corallococcus sp. CA053C]
MPASTPASTSVPASAPVPASTEVPESGVTSSGSSEHADRPRATTAASTNRGMRLGGRGRQRLCSAAGIPAICFQPGKEILP